MTGEEVREEIIDALKDGGLETDEILKRLPNAPMKEVLHQLIILEKAHLLKRELLDHANPLMTSRWSLVSNWQEILEKQTHTRPVEEVTKEVARIKTLLVATIPPDFREFDMGTKIVETRDALAELFSNVKEEILVSSPYMDESLRLFFPIIKNSAPKGITFKLMTTTPEGAFQRKRQEVFISDLKKQFPNAEIIFFEGKFGEGGAESVFFKTHAKIIVVDGREMLITSANLMRTSYLDNFEMGILTTDPGLVSETKRLFNHLILTLKNG